MRHTFNIAGTCVCRDTFGMHEDDGGHAVVSHANAFSPLFSGEKPSSVNMEKWDGNQEGTSDFFRRGALRDLTRGIFSFLEEHDAEYLILDVGLLSWDYLRLEDGTMLFNTNIALYRSMALCGAIPAIERESVPFDCMPVQEMKERLERYAGRLLTLYRPEQIILFEVKNAFVEYDEKKGDVTFYPENKRSLRTNAWIDTAFHVMRQALGGCHVVRLPGNVIGDASHKWGSMPMHYTREYYDYALKAVSVITEKRPRREESMLLDALLCSCEERYAERLAAMDNARIMMNMYGSGEKPRKVFSKMKRLGALGYFYARYSWYRLFSHVGFGSWKERYVRKKKVYRNIIGTVFRG